MKKSEKKRSRPQKHKQEAPSSSEKSKEEEIRVLKNLTEAFTDVSIEDVTAAYHSANGDPNRAAVILVSSAESAENGSISTSTSSKVFSSDSYGCSSSSSNSSSTGFKNEICEGFRGVKAKKVVAATGMVSSFLGKDYGRSIPKKDSSRDKGFHDEPLNEVDSEQFLCSMLGYECELNPAVVRDVLCQCRYDLHIVNMALNVLLELSGSSCQQPNHGDFQEHSLRRKSDTQFLLESTENVTDRASDSSSSSSENECQESIWTLGNNQRRKYSQVLTGTMEYPSPPSSKVSVSELPQKVLESLFNSPPISSQHEPNSMNWRNVVKKMESLSQSFDPPTNLELQKIERDKGEEYRVYRESAKQHWDSMKSCYQKATTAYTNGERQYATYLSEQGRIHNKMAREADERASQNIFTARNKSIENMITIDLHGQHVKQAMRLLKLHLLFGAYVRSVRLFKVITGCGSHGVGKSKLKQSVMNLLEKEGIKWKEENRGTLLITLHGNREFTFLDADSDTD